MISDAIRHPIYHHPVKNQGKSLTQISYPFLSMSVVSFPDGPHSGPDKAEPFADVQSKAR